MDKSRLSNDNDNGNRESIKMPPLGEIELLVQEPVAPDVDVVKTTKNNDRKPPNRKQSSSNNLNLFKMKKRSSMALNFTKIETSTDKKVCEVKKTV